MFSLTYLVLDFAVVCTWDLSTSQWAHTCNENVLKARFQDVQNVNSEDVHKT